MSIDMVIENSELMLLDWRWVRTLNLRLRELHVRNEEGMSELLRKNDMLNRCVRVCYPD